ncbi:structural protein [Halomonas sp. DX6]|uniref:Structural protein n=2 Tax=Billgrantia bachuensis TaxID=2717286 RepID=A0ABX0PQW2_9GAMM|nr:structural protein [Halomonas bachuensis]
MSQPRGIRNNNPGNIEYTGTRWQGLDNPPSDGRFMRFKSPEYGIRALARVLTTYQTKHGLDYIGGIIQRWAPSHENNSAAYAGFVADRLGVRATDRIDVQARMPELVEAIISYENGQQPYSMATINRGVSMA